MTTIDELLEMAKAIEMRMDKTLSGEYYADRRLAERMPTDRRTQGAVVADMLTESSLRHQKQYGWTEEQRLEYIRGEIKPRPFSVPLED